MEALQIKPASAETVPQPVTESQKSYLTRIRSQLARIPTTPSFISVPSSSSTTESAESLSTTAQTITASEALTEPSTVSTSILSLPEVFMVQKFYVSPSMPVDGKIQFIWTHQIRARLSGVLLHEIRTGTCVQELMGVGRKPSSLKPTLVVSCGDIATKKSVEKVFKSQGWLHELLKAHDIMFVALVSRTSLSAGRVLDSMDGINLSEVCSVKLPLGPVATSCGASLIINASGTGSETFCTLGGLILIDGEIYGLTAGHPFENLLQSKPTDHTLNYTNQVSELVQDIESDEASDEPFIFNEDENNSLGSLSRTSTFPLQGSDEFSRVSVDNSSLKVYNVIPSLSPSANWSLPFDAIVPFHTATNETFSNKTSAYQDWALLKELPQSIAALPNKISHVDSRHDILLEEIVTGSTHGEVTITVAGIGAQLGHLHNSTAMLNVNGYTLDVQLVTLEHILPLGSSGAWVIRGKTLCGFIVATRQDVPWAYMVPIEPILNDIKQKIGAVDVRLPARGEIESLTISAIKSKSAESIKPAVSDDGSSYGLQRTVLHSLQNDRSQASLNPQAAAQQYLVGSFNDVNKASVVPARPVGGLATNEETSASAYTDLLTTQSTSIRTGSNCVTRVGSSLDSINLRSSFLRNLSQHLPFTEGSPFVKGSKSGEERTYAEKSHSYRNRTEKKQLQQVRLGFFARYMITAALCSLYILIVLLWQRKGALNGKARKGFNIITMIISLALSLNIASAFKAMALNMRWPILHARRHSLMELDYILRAYDLGNLIKCTLRFGRRDSMLVIGVLGWFIGVIVIQSGIVLLSATHDFVSGTLEPGNIIIPDMNYFYPFGQGSQIPTTQDEEYAAHLYGEYSQVWGVNSTGIFPIVGEIYQSKHSMLWLDTNSSKIDLIFTNKLTDDSSDVSTSIYTDRKINITWECEPYKVIMGGNGSTQNIEVEGIGNIPVPETPQNSLAYFTDDNYRCKNDIRCSTVQAFETSNKDPWYYRCDLTIGNTFDDPTNVSYISDQMAQIAINSITRTGYADLSEQSAQVYAQASLWGAPHRGNQTGIGLTIATFALGSIAGAIVNNPSTTYEGMVPTDSLHLQLSQLYFYLIISLILGCHLLFWLVVLFLTDNAAVGPESPLSMSMLLQPITDGLHHASLDGDDETFKVSKGHPFVKYENDIVTGKWGFYRSGENNWWEGGTSAP